MATYFIDLFQFLMQHVIFLSPLFGIMIFLLIGVVSMWVMNRILRQRMQKLQTLYTKSVETVTAITQRSVGQEAEETLTQEERDILAALAGKPTQ